VKCPLCRKGQKGQISLFGKTLSPEDHVLDELEQSGRLESQFYDLVTQVKQIFCEWSPDKQTTFFAGFDESATHTVAS
jgi:hypothetical protein